MGFIRFTIVTAVLSVSSTGHAQYGADGTKTTFISIVNNTEKVLKYVDSLVGSSKTVQTRMKDIRDVFRSIGSSLKSWNDLIENLTNLTNVFWGTAAVAAVILIIMQTSMFCYDKITSTT